MRTASWLSVLSLALLGAGCSCSDATNTHGDGGGNTLDGSVDDGSVDDGGGARGDGSMDAATGADAGPTSSHVSRCPDCPCFPGTDCSASGVDAGPAPPACTGPGASPTLVYPPDQVLLPPNTNVIEVQFLPGAGNTLFELDFQNAATDVRVITRCEAITNTRGVDTGGCGFALTQEQWGWIADVNRGGDPLRVTVRAAPEDGSCVGTSDAREISFASEDVEGAVYYWQSVTVDGTPGRAGGIYRFDFGRRDVAPEAFLESSPDTGNRCYGCHFVSRDGQRITYGSDDPDSDDEYGDLSSFLMDVGTRTIAANRVQPGFRTFTSDHTSMLASDGRNRNHSPAFYRLDGTDASQLDSRIHR